MLVASGMKWRILAIMGVLTVVMMAMLIVLFPHRMERLASFSDAGANTYHIDNALIAIGKGGLFGVGVGNSVQATGYLPESINDSVFAVMGETFGFVGLMAVIGCFTVLLLRLLRTAERLDEPAFGAGRLVVVGVFAWVAGHVIINVMGMTGLIPIKGITLPFLSSGGTSMMFMAMAMGICLQLSGWTKREVINENISGRRGERGSRYAGSGRRS
jgi:cell division protein FtsW